MIHSQQEMTTVSNENLILGSVLVTGFLSLNRCSQGIDHQTTWRKPILAQ